MGRARRTSHQIDRTVGVILRLQRVARGFDQIDVARRIGVTQATYSKLESGRTAMTVVRLRKIAHAIGTTPQAVLEQLTDDGELRA